VTSSLRALLSFVRSLYSVIGGTGWKGDDSSLGLRTDILELVVSVALLPLIVVMIIPLRLWHETVPAIVRRQEHLKGKKRCGRPTLNAEFLFYLFLDKQNCDAIVGDLEERFTLILAKVGKHRANLWYWSQAVSSVGPIMWAAMKGTVKKVSGVSALMELYRKIRH
jgi:hypothetical protein